MVGAGAVCRLREPASCFGELLKLMLIYGEVGPGDSLPIIMNGEKAGWFLVR
jgi:hypothetical protein